jgi:hypothetical protein
MASKMARVSAHSLPVVDQPHAVTGLAREEHVLGNRQGRDEAELLEDHADPERLGIEGAADLYRLSVDLDLTAVGGVDPFQDLHQGRLAGTVTPDESVDLARHQLKVDTMQDPGAGEALGDSVIRTACDSISYRPALDRAAGWRQRSAPSRCGR